MKRLILNLLMIAALVAVAMLSITLT